MRQPEISVIVPFYNVEPYFAQCLDSIAAQTFADFEVLCIDDCGTDGSLAIAELFAQRDPRFKIIRHARNAGPGGARNTGIQAAAGKYTAFVDPDDWILPEKLEKERAAIEKTGLPWVWSKLLGYDKAIYEEKRGWNSRSGEQGPVILNAESLARYSPSMCNKFFRTSSIRDGGVYCPDRVRPEDLGFYFKFAMLHPETFILNDFLYVYRRREGSDTDEVAKGKAKCSDIVAVFGDCYDFLCEKNLLEANKNALITLIAKHSERYFRHPAYTAAIITEMKRLLERIDYKNTFLPAVSAYSLDLAMRFEKKSRLSCFRKLLLSMNKLNPFTALRRKIRMWISIYC